MKKLRVYYSKEAGGGHADFICARYDITLYGVLWIDTAPEDPNKATRMLFAPGSWQFVAPLFPDATIDDKWMPHSNWDHRSGVREPNL